MANIHLKGRREPIEVPLAQAQEIKRWWVGDTRGGVPSKSSGTKISTEWDTFELGEIKRIELSGAGPRSLRVEPVTTKDELADCQRRWDTFEREPGFSEYEPGERNLRFYEFLGAGKVSWYEGRWIISVRPGIYERWHRIVSAWNDAKPLTRTFPTLAEVLVNPIPF